MHKTTTTWFFLSSIGIAEEKESWAVKTELGWTLSGPLPKPELAQIAEMSHFASEDDGLGIQLICWFRMGSYATTMNVRVSWHQEEGKKALEQPDKTTKLVDGQYEVGYSGQKAMWLFRKSTFRHDLSSVHGSESCHKRSFWGNG